MENRKNKTAIFTGPVIILFCILLSVSCSDRKNANDKDKNSTAKQYSEVVKTESSVFLYFGDRKRATLVSEERAVPHPENPVLFAKQIISELIKGSNNGLMRTVPSDTMLRALYITRDKTAFADFSRTIRDHHPGGVAMENITVYSIVNSLTLNIPEVEQVKILVEGQETDTLAGHVDTRNPLSADMLIVR